MNDTARIDARLAELRAEYEEGTRQIQQLEARLAELRTTMLRISGAIQVLEEMKTGGSEPSG